MLSGDNGILQRTTDAKTKTERQSIIEQARTDILGQIAENKGENITQQQLKDTLNTYFDEDEVEALTIPDDTSTSNDVLTSKEGKYKIKLSEIYSGNFTLISNKKRLVDLIVEGSMYGYSVSNYSANGITDWSVLYNDGNNVYIISDMYIPESIYLPSENTEAYMKDYTQWTQYVDTDIPKAKAFLGPTADMLLKSYEGKYGNKFELSIEPGSEPELNNKDALYVMQYHSGRGISGYWLATAYEEQQTGKTKNIMKVASISSTFSIAGLRSSTTCNSCNTIMVCR